jgi:hypothetical protein
LELKYSINSSKVPELWQDAGNVLVYLFPKVSGHGPSFKLSAEIFASSPALTALLHGDVYSNRSASQMSYSSRTAGQFVVDPRTQQAHVNAPISTGASPNTSHTDGSDDSREARGLVDEDGSQMLSIWLPLALSDETGKNLTQNDIRNLVSVRNLFAFLAGQSLVATPAHPNLFDIFSQISKHLLEFKFSNMDGSTFGETPDGSFTSYLHELGILDMRNNCEKVIEGLLLGEKMRSVVLWNESFVHAVGMYEDLQRLCPEKYRQLSHVAVQRLERANMDLEKRKSRIGERLSDFDFPSVFSGITNSKTAEERETANFEQWKSAFLATRRFYLQYLKTKYRSWPPKKTKNTLTIPGLNRRVLQSLSADLATMYDLLVDRKHPSSRLKIFGKQFPSHPDRRIEALRKVLQEYDISGSPVYPTMPFDAPRLPRIAHTTVDDSAANSKKKIGKNELLTILGNSYNIDIRDSHNQFAQLWMGFEAKHTGGMTIDKIANFRLGAWLFMYCVLQSLPLLTVDAPCVQFTEGVEYFLCEPPRGRLHWSKESTQKDWFRDPVTGVITQMAKDALELSDDAIYRLSHCWKVGEIWEQELTMLPGNVNDNHQRNDSRPDHPTQRTSPQKSMQPPRLMDSPHMHSHSAKSSPMLQSQPFPPQQNAYPTPPYGPVYEVPHQSSAPHLPPPLQPIPSEHAYHTDYQLQQHYTQSPNPSHFSPINETWEEPQPISPTNTRQYSPPQELPLHDNVLLPPPTIPGITYDESISYGSNPGSAAGSRNSSPYGGLGRRGNRESILMMGLERLPVPNAPSPTMSREERSSRTASMTFEDFLPAQQVQQLPPSKDEKRGRVPSRSGWI